jgi:eukaryotic-like serine/threonine-protein kinase
MGEVYRARDTRLDRDVAVKVLPAHLASDPQFKQRFEREARTVSSLNHPHICTLYDIGREGETDFLVMEYLEGETLAARLKRGKLPLPELVKIGLEIADALEKAHRKGVVHRDLKPGNIMLTKGGAKLMDFGLAKPTGLGGAAGAGSVPLFSAAMTVDGVSPGSPLTSAGTLVGTIQYMSPEQIEGKEADPRSDIFAFGSTLYEMATGEPAFQGKSQISVASAILEKEPEPISTKQPLVPAALDRVVGQCLAKDPDERFQNAHDVGLELKWVGAAISEGLARTAEEPGGQRPLLQRALPWAVSAVFLVLAVFLAFAWFRGSSAPVQSIRALISPPENSSFAFSLATGAPVLSPDGTRLVFRVLGASGREALWVRPLDSLTAQPLQGTEGGTFPFWAPDSRQLGFFQDGKLKKIDVTGGPPVLLCDAPNGRGGAWSRNNVIVFAPEVHAGLSSVPAAGGTPTAIAGPTGSSGRWTNRWPGFLPDGRHFLYLSGEVNSPGTPKLGIHLGEVGSNQQKFLLQADSDALYAAPGYLLFLRGDTLMAQRFDAGSLKLEGEAFPVAEHVPSPRSFRLGLFSVSQAGLLVYATGTDESGGQLVWMDASGKEIGKVGQPGVYGPTLSADGTRLGI